MDPPYGDMGTDIELSEGVAIWEAGGGGSTTLGIIGRVLVVW